MLRPTPGDPWGVEQHHLNTGAEENQQLNPGGPSNRQKSSGPNRMLVFSGVSNNPISPKYIVVQMGPILCGNFNFRIQTVSLLRVASEFAIL